MLLVRQVARPEGALLCAVELLPDVPCGRMRVPMLLVRHVARPDGALLCAVELLPDAALRLPWR